VPQLLAEEKVDFTRELAVMVGRSPMGQTAVWPVVETWQQNGVCKEAIAPAPGLETTKAKEITEAILEVAGSLDVTGVMAAGRRSSRSPAPATSPVSWRWSCSTLPTASSSTSAPCVPPTPGIGHRTGR